MLDLGIIRASTSPYASPIVIVKKKDESNRICVDYRKLNKVIVAEDWDTHIRVLDELMNRLQQANLTARPTKCVFRAKSVEFLGHQVGFDWITVNDNNLEKIRMAQRPTTKK